MKKVLIILCCVALLLPAAALSAFAEEDFYTITFENLKSNSVSIYYSSDLVNFDRVTVPASGSVNLSLSGNTTYAVYSVSGSYREYMYFKLPDTSGQELSVDSSSPTVFDSESLPSTVYISSSTVSDSTLYYLSVSVPLPDPYGELGVNDGVDSSISYTGQVLHFLATNTTTIVLIGLSVAMFAVLPFAISKIKQIIKGY